LPLFTRLPRGHLLGNPVSAGISRRILLPHPPKRSCRSSTIETSPPLYSSHIPSGAGSVVVPRSARPFCSLYTVSQGNVMPTIAFEERSCWSNISSGSPSTSLSPHSSHSSIARSEERLILIPSPTSPPSAFAPYSESRILGTPAQRQPG